MINNTFDALPEADEWAKVEEKREHLIESWNGKE
ncbi:MAG: DUF3470 domain-containing protein [Balneolaceae bacterium]|nr:DUF3470 domain-containing protein [Balneolaceae bacterium]